MQKQYSKYNASSSDHKKFYIEGYASIFSIADKDQDIIQKGAFTKSINSLEKHLKLLWQHDTKMPIGIVTSISEDNYGLFMCAYIVQTTQKAQEAAKLVEEGIIDSLSIGFIPRKVKTDATGLSRIIEATLYEISLVTFPANPMSKISYIKNATKN
jgi:HK97 family phage prohead protease